MNSTREWLDHGKKPHLNNSHSEWLGPLHHEATHFCSLWYYWPQLILWKQYVGRQRHRNTHQYHCQISLLKYEFMVLLAVKRKLCLNDSNSPVYAFQMGGMADLIRADFQVFITIRNGQLWPITLQSTRRLCGRLTTCYASAASKGPCGCKESR
jgi:hypothetical protein